MRKTLGIVSLTTTLVFSTTGYAAEQVYVQASKGSFNDAAIQRLFAEQPGLEAAVSFAGTPLNTFEQAVSSEALAFSAVENSTIDGKLVQATVKAFQQYQLVDVKAFITTPIEMCVLQPKSDAEKGVKINTIASHPAALKQIDSWKHSFNPAELEIPEGTAAAARMVSAGELPSGTAAIGACVLNTVYPNLAIVEQGVQDNKNNKTSFMLMDVEPRSASISEPQARVELAAAIELGKKLATR